MKSTRRLAVYVSLAAILLIGGIGGGFWLAKRIQPQVRQTILPASISQSLSFPAYASRSGNTTVVWQLNKAKTTYDNSSGVLTLYLSDAKQRVVILTEQSTPQVFADVPTQYSKMLNSLNQYDEIQTSFGTVTLTHPKELQGGQTAVINKSGTLLFAKPNTGLSSDEWKVFFEELVLLASDN